MDWPNGIFAYGTGEEKANASRNDADILLKK